MARGKRRVIILGASGRDFHNFNAFFKNNADYEIVAFTATQLPNIAGREYPPELAGDLYPDGIPIYPVEKLPELLQEFDVDLLVLAYSDVSNQEVMEKAALAAKYGASFMLLGPEDTMYDANIPVISVCAVRTGSGKSTVSRKVIQILDEYDIEVNTVRHPMPYGDLSKMIIQKFEKYQDLEEEKVTIEEREEYEPHIDHGNIVYAGVDYKKILEKAQEGADVILWDGGNNDFPFYRSDLGIVVADGLRPGHVKKYWPSGVTAGRADIFVINKVVEASFEQINEVEEELKDVNPNAEIILSASVLTADNIEKIKDKKVLVVEDGPTVTHGDMAYGAGYVASKRNGAAEIVDPRPWAIGNFKEIFEKYQQLGPVLPTLGYGDEEINQLEQIINQVEADLVVAGTPIKLDRFLDINKPIVDIRYKLDEIGEPNLKDLIEQFLEKEGLK